MPKKTSPSDPVETSPSTQTSSGLWEEVWAFFASMKVGLVLLLVLAFATGLGTIIPQNVNPEWYIQTYGQGFATILYYLGLLNVYHSPWFVGLLGLLSLNLLVCSINRWNGLVRETRIPAEPLSEDALPRMKVARTAKIKGSEAEIREKIQGLLRRRHYRTATLEKGTTRMLYADKGRFGVFGSLITHVSIVLILLGGLYGALRGYSTTVAVNEGDSFTIPRTNFQVRVDDFTVKYRPDFRPQQYYSTLTVSENGQETKHKTIYVNSPLVYKGYKFYQSFYGWTVDLQATGNGGTTSYSFKNPEIYQIPGTGWAVKMYAFIPDYDPQISTMNTRFQSLTPLPKNPRVAYILLQNGVPVDVQAAEFNKPITTPDNQTTFTFTGFREYTGLQVRQDPGLPLVYAGCILMIVGLFLSFYILPRRMWVATKSQGDSTLVTLGGNGRKNNLGFEAEVEALFQDINS